MRKGLCAIAVAFFLLGMAPQGASAATLTFLPTDDTCIRSDSTASTACGSAASLNIDGVPAKDLLFKFVVSGIGSQPVLSAKLKLTVDTNGGGGGSFFRVADNSWTESTANWNNAPAISDMTPIASLGTVSPGVTYEVDLSSYITGDGTYSMRVTSASDDSAYYRSTEYSDPAFAPLLTIATGSTGGADNPPSAPLNLRVVSVSAQGPSTNDLLSQLAALIQLLNQLMALAARGTP